MAVFKEQKAIEDFEKYSDLYKLMSQFNKGDSVITHIEMIKKAHADGDYSVKEIISHQKAYQNWLFRELNGNVGTIMKYHRSVGFEFEFATYKASVTFPSHILISSSEPFSNVFKTPFRLETDLFNELEIGIPPLLISNYNQKIRKNSIYKIWTILKKMMGHISALSQDYDISYLTGNLQKHGLGNHWEQNYLNEKISITKRKKHWEKEHQVYSQLNISLKADEIASSIINYGISSYQSARYEYFKEAYIKLYSLVSLEIKDRQLITSMVHFCKGLSHILAIPSLLLLKELPENPQNNRGVYSSVKEIFGVWVKDSITNLVDNSLKDPILRKIARSIIVKYKKQMDVIMKEQLIKASRIIKRITASSEVYAEMSFAEYEITVEKILKRLESVIPRQKKTNHKELYRNETFPSNGDGVRKETFMNIYSPVNDCFHLTEFRNDMQIVFFLNEY